MPVQCGRGEPSPRADVAALSAVRVDVWQGRAQSPCRCGSGEPSSGGDVVDCGSGEPSCGGDVAGVDPVPVQM